MATNFQWRGPQVRAAIEARTRRVVSAACIIVAREAKELISISGTGRLAPKGSTSRYVAPRYAYMKKKGKHVLVGGKIVVRHQGGNAAKVYGAFPSKAGQPPRKQTGHLRRSVTYNVNGLVGRVGTPIKYGRYLELGTRHMKPRPWLRRSLRTKSDEIIRLLRQYGFHNARYL